jgi:class 3 adenylate cyclase/tetratricopeptide (TPR) repeat protein
MTACANCGTENPSEARFCMTCASPLEARASARGDVRKTVTVVFTDVAGSTPLGEQLDPEALRAVMSTYFERMRSVVERHGGSVEKFIGDAVMAVFGIPTLHEDDALRAVRAALEMGEALADLNGRLQRERGVQIRVRTGVNTGEVVAGDPAGGQRLVTGDAVNTAARLQQAAAPGEILIGRSTYRLVREAVRVQEMPPLPLKGKADPTAAFRLLEVRTDAEAVPRHLDSPMVGRAREGKLLTLAFEQAEQDRVCHLVTILGSPGVGKSRLVEEFLGSLAANVTALRGRCLSYGDGITFWPVREIVRQAAGIGEAEGTEEARTKLAALCRGVEPEGVVFERVAEVLGIGGESGPQEETFWGIRRLFEAMGARAPVVIVFDDIHWAEPTLLDFLEHLTDWTRDAALLVICLSRLELLESRPAWGGGKMNATAIQLEPLTEDQCALLMENLLGRAQLPAEVRDRVVDAAEGNPLFVEQTLSMLIDDGLLRQEDGHWLPAADLSQVAVPPSIQALMAARLDRLGGEERAVVERASVVGRIFYRGAVSELTPEPSRPSVPGHLTTLVRRDLVRPHAPQFDDETFRFRHMLIRDAAYEAMPKEARADLHRRFADWLASRAGERLEEYEEVLGYHLEQAYRYRAELGPADQAAEDLAVRAGELLGRAGLRAVVRGDTRGSESLLARATSLLPREHPQRIRLLPDLAGVLQETAELGRAGQALDEALELSARQGERVAELRALLERANLRLSTDPTFSMGEALAEGQEVLWAAEDLGDARLLLKAQETVGWFLFWIGRSREAETLLEQALEEARARGTAPGQVVELYQALSAASMWGSKPVEEAMRRWQPVAKETSRVLQGLAHTLLGALHAMRGDAEQARLESERGEEALVELGMTMYLKSAHPTALVGLLNGDNEGVVTRMRESVEFLRKAGETGFMSTSAAFLAEGLYRLGRHQEAEEAARLSQRNAAEDDAASQISWRMTLAKILATSARIDEAETLARQAVDIADRTDHLNERGDSRLALATVLRETGRKEEAIDEARRAWGEYRAKGNVVGAGWAEELLRGLGEEPAPYNRGATHST